MIRELLVGRLGDIRQRAAVHAGGRGTAGDRDVAEKLHPSSGFPALLADTRAGGVTSVRWSSLDASGFIPGDQIWGQHAVRNVSTVDAPGETDAEAACQGYLQVVEQGGDLVDGLEGPQPVLHHNSAPPAINIQPAPVDRGRRTTLRPRPRGEFGATA